MMQNNPNQEPNEVNEDVSMYYPDGDAEHIARDDHDEAFLNETIKKKPFDLIKEVTITIYLPFGGFTVSEGEYGHEGGKVGTWTGEATEVVFTASINQVRASQIVVEL